VAYAVIKYLLDQNVSTAVMKTGGFALDRMRKWMQAYPETINDVRGRGLLLAIEFYDEKTAGKVTDGCLNRRLFVRQTQGNMIRIFPALNIRQEEMEEGLMLLEEAIDNTIRKSS
jgi:acetylornithine/N-succinyldiaminopimelate aminotransferase